MRPDDLILVTGGTGMIGAHLLYELAGAGRTVRALYRNEDRQEQVRKIFSCYTDDPGRLFDRITWFRGDLLDPESLGEALHGVSQVYHTAAMVSFNPKDKDLLMRNNVEGTGLLVDICLEKKVVRLCFVSSTAALGSAPDGVPVDESFIWSGGKNRSAYSVSKFKSEMEVWRGIEEGLNACIVNPSIVIGPGDWTRSSSNLFLNIWKGMKYYTEGVTGYVDVRDLVSVMVFLMEKSDDRGRYIVSSENLSYKDVFTMVASALGKKPPVKQAGRLLMNLAWRLDWLRSVFSGKKRVISRETVRAGLAKRHFSNRKVADACGIRFMPVERSIRETAEAFIKDQSL